MRVKPVFCLLPILFFAAACAHRQAYNITPPPFTAYKNIVYGTDSLQQDLDLYLPPCHDTQCAVILLLHGGGWVQGDKTAFDGAGLDTFFTAAGYAVVNMNYRLDGAYKYPAPVEDVGMVMDFIRQHSTAWHIDAGRVCILGKSSGAHLALLYAYSHNADHRIKAVIDAFGPTDFLDSSVLYTSFSNLVSNLLGPYSSNMQTWHDASPIFYMAGAVPTIILQGTVDSTVFPVQSQLLADSLNARGVPDLYIPWVGKGHGWDQAEWLACRAAVMQWLRYFL